MDSSILGLILESSPLIAAERQRLIAGQGIESIREATGDIPATLPVITVIEIGMEFIGLLRNEHKGTGAPSLMN